MHLSFALFADAANLSQEGKLNVMGVFDAVQVGSLPAVHPRAHLVLRLKGGRADAGTHQLTLRWTNPRGDEVWSTTGELNVAIPPAGALDMDVPLIAAVDLPLEIVGIYVMHIDLDGAPTAEVPLHVRTAGLTTGPTVPMGVMGSGDFGHGMLS